MTPKEIEDRIIEHLETQKKPAMDTSGYKMCAYRSQEGLKCAVGCLISDEYYDPVAETAGLYYQKVTGGVWASSRGELDLVGDALARMLNNAGIPATEEIKQLLHEWQNRHDDQENWGDNGYCGPLDSVL